MKKNVLLLSGFVMSLAGCSLAPQRSTPANYLQIKVSQMERQLQSHEEEIASLKNDLADLSDQTQPSRRDFSEPTRVSPRPIPAPVSYESSDAESIIRVPVSAHDVQEALKNAGYYTGTIDGKIGAGSRKAISDFQRDHDLNPDGIVGKNTWVQLKSYLK